MLPELGARLARKAGHDRLLSGDSEGRFGSVGFLGR
jgi:hypothetical protein